MARKEKKYHFIYKTTNILTNKYYIGMHSTNKLDDGYLGSGKRLRYSINKYGEKNHKREILEFLSNRKSLIKREKNVVNLNEIAKIECMNLMEGGCGGFTVEQQRINVIKSNKKQRILKKTDIEWVKRKSINMSLTQKLNYKNGRIPTPPNFTGKTHKEETKKKIGQTNSIKQRGKNNSQYGTCWITNNIENKKIKKTSNIPNGWKLGRKISRY